MTLMTHCVFRRSAFAERTLLARKGIGLLHLDVGRPDHLAPFFGFVSNELAEVDGRHGHWIATQVGEPLLDLGFGEPDVISRFSMLMISPDVLRGALTPKKP